MSYISNFLDDVYLWDIPWTNFTVLDIFGVILEILSYQYKHH